MTDISNPETTEDRQYKVVDVKNIEDIVIKKDAFLFNRSHANDLDKESKLLFDSNATIVYRITDEVDEITQADGAIQKNKVEPYGVAVVDLNKLTTSLAIYSEGYVVPFIRLVNEQIKHDYLIAQGNKFMADMGAPVNLKLVRSKNTLLRNSESAIAFLNKLSDLGIDFESSSKLKNEIIEAVENGKKLFEGKSYGKGLPGWTAEGDGYTPNKPTKTSE